MECGCLPCDSCRDIEWTEYRNKICAISAGGLFSLGWWLAIDASAVNHADTNDLYHLCGVFSAVSMFMVNTVSNGHLQGDSLYTDGVCGGVAAKIWFFLGFLIGFGALMGSFVIFFGDYLSENSPYHSVVPGVQFMLQNLFILAASLIYRFGRVEDIWG